MGVRVRLDDRWRIVIPLKFRKGLKPKDELIIEERGSEIVLRRVSREDILREFNELILFVDEKYSMLNAERGKHKYGGFKE